MPSISMFYGIVIYMYFKDNRQHNKPIFMPGIRVMKPFLLFLTVN